MAIDRPRAERAVAELLAALGRDPEREPELRETPARVTEAFADDLLSGYAIDIVALLAEGSPAARDRSAGIVVVRDISVVSVCPHHLLPSLGHATVAYRPGARILGLGTVARVVDAFARRLTLQEQIGEQVAQALVLHGGARGAFCHLALRHGCLAARGARQSEATVVTHAAAGDLAEPSAVAELELSLRGDAAR